MDPTIGWILLIVGVGLLLYWAKTKVSIGHPAVAPILAVLLIAAPFYFGAIDLEGLGQEPVDTGTTIPTVSGCPDWTITESDGSLNSDANLNADTNLFTVPVTINSTTNVLNNNQAALNFSIRPSPKPGQDTTDLGTIYYEVTNYNTEFESNEVLEVSSNEYLANWTNDLDDDVKVDAHSSYEMTDTGWANLTLNFDSGNDTWCEEVDSDDLYDSIAEFQVRFYDGCGWSETFRINLLVTSVTA